MTRGKCMGCNASIVWIKTTANKAMPCDADLVVITEPGDKRIIVTDEGKTIVKPPVGFSGHIPHWSSCPSAGLFRTKI